MKIGIPEYELAYLGQPLTKDFISNEEVLDLDFLMYVKHIIRFNMTSGFDTTVIDLSEFEFISELILYKPYSHNKDWSKLLDDIKYSSSFRDHRVYFYAPRDYFLGNISADGISTCKKLFNKLNEILNYLEVESGIIVRIGSAYGNRKTTLRRFAKNYESLSTELKEKILVTNDDRPSLFSAKDLLSEVSIKYRIPIVFRTLGHYFNPGSLSHRDALLLSLSTWPDNKLPLIIHAESKVFDNDGIPESRLISDYLTKRIPTFNNSLCVVIESTYKELSCIRYINEYKSLKPVIINRKK